MELVNFGGSIRLDHRSSRSLIAGLQAPGFSWSLLIAAQGAKILSIGLVAGIIGAVTGARLIEGLLYGVSPVDRRRLESAFSSAGVTGLWKAQD